MGRIIRGLPAILRYRRDDAAGHAGRLYDALSEALPGDRIFMDVVGIQPGSDFHTAIDEVVGSCDVLIALIGPRWLSASTLDGAPRLDQPDDFVRAEIKAALDRGVRVVPALLQGTPMPTSTDLPAPLAGLARRQAIELSETGWRDDVRHLVGMLRELGGGTERATQRPLVVAAPAAPPAPSGPPAAAGVIACPSCGEENPGRARFCWNCAAALTQASSARRETRRTVTVLFADVAGSTALGEQLDPESMRSLLSRYFAEMKQIIERHGGTVEKFIGDAVMAVFGIPVLHEDDALRAVRAAGQIRDALTGLNAELRAQRGIAIELRTGVNTGEVAAGDPAAGQTLVTGDAVNTAARLQQAAQPGEILLSQSTYRLVRDAVSAEEAAALQLKGKAGSLTPWRLLTVNPMAEGHARRLHAPMVGRARELARLDAVYRQALDDRAPQLFTLLGTAGVGKSRLVAEFLRAVAGEATIMRGRCLSYGEGITYWPLGEIVRQAAGIVEEDAVGQAMDKVAALLEAERDGPVLASRLCSAIGLSLEPAPQEEIFWAARKLLERLARQTPLVVLIEDIHWAEPTLLDLIEHVAELARDVPLLLLCPARLELLDSHPNWGGGKLNATTLLLEPLSQGVTAELMDVLPGGAAMPAELRARILAAAEGNPLYVEEMLGMLVDDGLLREDGDGWRATAELATLSVPPSVQALISARLDRLPASERTVAEHASVVGRIFKSSAVAELVPMR